MDLKTRFLKRRLNAGYALLLTAIVALLTALAVNQASAGWLARLSLSSAVEVEHSLSLAQVRSALVAFAVSQGGNSLSQPGNLPCPSLSPGGAPQTTCLSTNIGYLPDISVIKTNYTRNTVPMHWNSRQVGHHKSWAYAVSQQVLQANPLGWSQWVNFTLPGLTVLVDDMEYSDVVAVVADRLTPLGNNVVQASGSPALLSKADLLKAIATRQHFQIEQTVARWLAINHQKTPTPTENLRAAAGALIPVDSQCKCHCTATRCQCTCSMATEWQNATHPEQAIVSEAAQNITIPGPSRLASRWPVSSFSPSPLPGSACRPADPFTCPLAPAGRFCDCTFAWPTGALGAL